jgi:hypothetical protein
MRSTRRCANNGFNFITKSLRPGVLEIFVRRRSRDGYNPVTTWISREASTYVRPD